MIFMAVVVAYLLLGGLFFLSLEGPNEEAQVEQVREMRRMARENLKEFQKDFDRYIANFTNLSVPEVRNRTETLIELAVRFAIANQTIRSETDPTWDYAFCCFLC